MNPDSLPSASYRDAGVDIDAGNRAVHLIMEKVRSTFGPRVLAGIGGFGSLFAFGGYREPVLVASADGVGTKLKIAFAMDRHDTIGIDLVSHCVNDILTCGATPLFFLDYLAMAQVVPEKVAQIVGGLVDGCRATGCALVGGETAEMPGIYAEGEYDLAGFIVGVVEKQRVVDGSRIQVGDLVWGFPSSGLHTNGYSLVRKVFQAEPLARFFPELGRTLGEELLEPHRCYLEPVGRLLATGDAETRGRGDAGTGSEASTRHSPLGTRHSVDVRGLAHITGGGIPGNVARIIPAGRKALFRWGTWSVPRIFGLVRERGGIAQDEMLRTFNLGLGCVAILPPEDREEVRVLAPEAMLVGEIVASENDVKVEVVGA